MSFIYSNACLKDHVLVKKTGSRIYVFLNSVKKKKKKKKKMKKNSSYYHY